MAETLNSHELYVKTEDHVILHDLTMIQRAFFFFALVENLTDLYNGVMCTVLKICCLNVSIFQTKEYFTIS